MKRTFPLILAAALAANAAAQSGRRVTKPQPAPVEPTVQVEDSSEPEYLPPAPAELVVLPQSLLNRKLRSLDGKESFRLADFSGKVVVINLWASWCGPCRREVPEYERVRKEYASRGVEFIALTTEDPLTSAERVKQFVREFKFGFRQGWADPETAMTIMNGRNSIPQTMVVGPDGYVIRHWRGYSPGRSGDHLRETIKRALSESSTQTTRSQ